MQSRLMKYAYDNRGKIEGLVSKKAIFDHDAEVITRLISAGAGRRTGIFQQYLSSYLDADL